MYSDIAVASRVALERASMSMLAKPSSINWAVRQGVKVAETAEKLANAMAVVKVKMRLKDALFEPVQLARRKQTTRRTAAASVDHAVAAQHKVDGLAAASVDVVGA